MSLKERDAPAQPREAVPTTSVGGGVGGGMAVGEVLYCGNATRGRDRQAMISSLNVTDPPHIKLALAGVVTVFGNKKTDVRGGEISPVSR